MQLAEMRHAMTKAGSGPTTPSEPVAGVNRRCPLFPPLFERPAKAGVWQSLPCRQVVGLCAGNLGGNAELFRPRMVRKGSYFLR